MKKRRIDIRSPERALLTDTLPYEIPIFFTNSNFAILAMHHRMSKSNHDFHARLLLNQPEKSKPTRPLSFEIRRIQKSPRRISMAHPISQHRISQLYARYDHFISNACTRSAISLRYPSRVATHYIDPRYERRLPPSTEHADEDPAGFRDQNRWASTYFSYRDFNLSHKFFESDDFLELERRYSHLLKLDISRCFDSIYTHSIEWSMRGKEFSKQHISQKLSTFEASFDSSIRHGNWNETHGILVGPEYSRIFAEIILQSADRSVAEELKSIGSLCVIKRYVDDYYVFSNSTETLGLAEEAIRRSLRALNLHLNERKREVLTRPFVSEVSVARSNIAESIDKFFDSTISVTVPNSPSLDPRRIEQARMALLSRIRRVSVELSTPYERFSSFALTVIKNKLEELRSSLVETQPKFASGHLARLSWLMSTMRVAQFFYSTDHRATTSVKLAAVYSLLVDLSARLDCSRAPLERQILDGLRDDAMGTSALAADEVTRINHICCVDLLLKQDRRIELADIERYIGNPIDKEAATKLSAFQLVSMLFLCKKRQRFSKLLAATMQEIVRRVLTKTFRPLSDTSDAILLTEFIACPYIDVDAKTDVIKHCHELVMGATCNDAEAQKIATDSGWITFTDWASNADLAAMLARKELTPAYE